MKLNCSIAAVVLAALNLASAQELKLDKSNSSVVITGVHKNLTDEACDYIAEASKKADSAKFPQYLSSKDKRWKSYGFSRLVGDDLIVFRRAYEYYGRPVAITKDGLMIGPKVIKPSASVVRI